MQSAGPEPRGVLPLATRRVGRRLIPALLLIAALVGGLLARPWAEFAPYKLLFLFHPAERVENFRSMQRIFPSRVVRASATPFVFGRAERPLAVRYEYEGQTRTLEDFLERVVATGLLVIKDDAIVYEKYFNGADERSALTSWSMAKSFVATLVGMALRDGHIESLDDPISKYAPELERTGYAGVPIRHVLQMSSGVAFDETYDRQFSDINLFFAKIYALGRRADSVIADYPREHPSGEVLHYVSLDTQALGLMLRRIHGKPLAQVLEEQLWRPLGMEDAARWSIDANGDDGVELSFCCLNARLRDYAKLGRLYLQHGVWNGKRLLPPGFTEEATRPSAPHLQPGASPHDYGQRGYQYQWWSPPNSEGEYFAAGIWGQYIYVSEPDRLIIVRTSVDENFYAHMAETTVVFRAIRDAL